MQIHHTVSSSVVRVRVEDVLPSGLVVRIIKNGVEGFIPKRELSWDRRLSFRPAIPAIGDEFDALLLPQKGKRAVLSICRLKDPWANIGDKYAEGQEICGEVVNVRQFGAFVQIEPGVTAIVHPAEIPLAPDQVPQDALAPGDQVCGVIVGLDVTKRRCEVSLLEYIKRLPVNLEQRAKHQEELFSGLWRDRRDSQVNPLSQNNAQSTKRQIYRQPMPRFERVLVLDDDQGDCKLVANEIAKTFNVIVRTTYTLEDALRIIEQGEKYDLAVIDVGLGNNVSGFDAAEILAEHLRDMRIIFASSDPRAERNLRHINGQKCAFIAKVADYGSAVCEQITKEITGYWDEVDTSGYAGRESFVQKLGMESIAAYGLDESLHKLLTQLQQTTGVTHTFVIEVDAHNRLASILATAPPIDPQFIHLLKDGLYYSPARQVVEEETIFHETRWHKKDRRFQNFLPQLEFRACYGTPLTIPGMSTRHALFLLDEQREKFEDDVIQRAETTADLVEVALERSLLFDYMRRYEERYASGELIGSLVHELRTKMNACSGQLTRLEALLENDPTSARDAARKLSRSVESLTELVDSYSRMARGDTERVDVNELVRKVRHQLEMRAKEAHVRIEVKLQPNLRQARAIRSRLEQVVMNVVLNAIQQTERQAREMARIAKIRNDEPNLQGGVVTVQTYSNASDPNDSIHITVLDTGPGIHRRLQDGIFLLDTSTRETGHGLGLFIARNLIEAMGGSIVLAESTMFIGSMFSIRVPAFARKEE